MNSEKRHIVFFASNLPPYMTVAGNSSALEFSGVNAALISLIAQRFRWTYSWIYLGPNVLINDSANKKGLISYLLDGDVDTIVAAIVPFAERFKLIDFTMPTTQGPDMFLIPYPGKSIQDYALGHPFQREVWAVLVVSLITVVFFWHFSNFLFSKCKIMTFDNSRISFFTPVDYFVSVILGQGNACLNKKLYIRLVAGVWCLAAAVLVPAYCSTLTSYSMLPVEKPLIGSVSDITNVPGLRIAVDRGKGVDAMLEFMAARKDTSLGKLAMAVKNTTFRCNTSMECYSKVLSGGHVYISSAVILKKMILDDFKEKNVCRCTLAKHPLSEYFVVWGVAKHSKPYLNVLNKGLLEISAFGLSKYWEKQYFKEAKQCLKHVQSTRNKRLSLADISSSFLVLIAGWGVSVCIFIFELLFHRVRYRRGFKRCQPRVQQTIVILLNHTVK